MLFPQPFPDETIHSLAGRYHRLVANDSYRQTSYELFGRYSRTCGSTLPCGLAALSQRLGNQLSVNYLIQAHTLLPLFAPFLTSRQEGIAIATMSGPSGTGLKMTLGLTAAGFEHYGSLRFCSCCAGRDHRHKGQAYWHRIHQAPGVLVCPYHDVVLKVVKNRPSDGSHLELPDDFTDQDIGDSVANRADIPALSEVAQLTAWGLHNPTRMSKLHARDFLRHRVAELGFLHRGRLSLSLLHNYLSAAMEAAPRIREYQVLNPGGISRDTWVLQLLRSQRGSHHPFTFYFLCHLLGITTSWLIESEATFGTSDSSLRARTRRASCPTLTTPSDSEVMAHRERFTIYTGARVHDRPGYMWLYRNDRSWLSEYTSTHRAPRIVRPHVDWAARDAKLVGELPLARQALIEYSGRPVKITHAALARMLTHHHDFLRLPEKFPRAIEIADLLVETEHDFQLRKISRVLLALPQAEEVSISKLKRLARIRILRVSDAEVSDLRDLMGQFLVK
jgi:hypothetical protein